MTPEITCQMMGGDLKHTTHPIPTVQLWLGPKNSMQGLRLLALKRF